MRDPAHAPSFGHQEAAGTVDTVVSILQRDVPLAAPVSVTEVIDRDGGMIQLQEGGLKVHFPAGALTRKTRITITALEGSSVAYTFEPHGIKFKEAVTIDQAYQGTNAFAGGLSHYHGAYFPEDDGVDKLTGKARVTELFPIEVDQLGKKLRFKIKHFSGYLISVG
ncbi:MAG: hypothetical protein KY464_07910 [Gemmatimonadetes bacterium]|nr:hypothetical protein [Gemmatimonadota bacterium]